MTLGRREDAARNVSLRLSTYGLTADQEEVDSRFVGLAELVYVFTVR